MHESGQEFVYAASRLSIWPELGMPANSRRATGSRQVTVVPATRRRIDRNGSAMQLDQALDQRQAEARHPIAARRARNFRTPGGGRTPGFRCRYRQRSATVRPRGARPRSVSHRPDGVNLIELEIRLNSACLSRRSSAAIVPISRRATQSSNSRLPASGRVRCVSVNDGFSISKISTRRCPAPCSPPRSWRDRGCRRSASATGASWPECCGCSRAAAD